MTDQKTTPTVRIKPSSYQPTKAELDEDLRIADATPDEVAAAVMRPSFSVESQQRGLPMAPSQEPADGDSKEG